TVSEDLGTCHLLLLLLCVLSEQQCPSPCLCYESSDLVDCRSQGLDQVPPGVSSGTWLLDLSGNRVREVRSDSFVGLWSLKFLLMSNNSIHAVNCDNLRKLDLSYNRIRTIDTRAFHSLSRLRLLHLEGNRLNMLKDGLLSRHTHLQMSLNPWTCDCDLQRVFGKIQYVRHLHVEDYKAILCHAPPQQAGSPLASMDSQLCMAETASVLVITITVMLAVIGALVKAERNRKNKQAASDLMPYHKSAAVSLVFVAAHLEYCIITTQK
uniref:LRRNT domain-containing protein n=1 Tax=Xiphophorus couchianus TaxID=32473 RepID=A0A3B5L5J7_9TELE